MSFQRRVAGRVDSVVEEHSVDIRASEEEGDAIMRVTRLSRGSTQRQAPSTGIRHRPQQSRRGHVSIPKKKKTRAGLVNYFVTAVTLHL